MKLDYENGRRHSGAKEGTEEEALEEEEASFSRSKISNACAVIRKNRFSQGGGAAVAARRWLFVWYRTAPANSVSFSAPFLFL